MQMHVPLTGFDVRPDVLDKDDLEEVMRQVSRKGEENQVRSLISSPGDWPGGSQETDKYREAIHRDYDGTVLREDVLPNPPVRGQYGYAYLPLKDGAVPQRQKPFTQQGEAKEAMVKMVAEWADKTFIERPTGPVE